jgi:hypothetical protein
LCLLSSLVVSSSSEFFALAVTCCWKICLFADNSSLMLIGTGLMRDRCSSSDLRHEFSELSEMREPISLRISRNGAGKFRKGEIW